MDSLAKSYGKSIEKIPSDKIDSNMCFIIMVIIAYIIVDAIIFFAKPEKSFLYFIFITIFMLIIIEPFIIIELKIKFNDIDRKNRK